MNRRKLERKNNKEINDDMTVPIKPLNGGGKKEAEMKRIFEINRKASGNFKRYGKLFTSPDRIEESIGKPVFVEAE